jgi:tRNA(His) guanylyltransferase
MEIDALGDRMKMYERAGTPERFMPLLPVMARIDGRAFHSFVQGLERPYDTRLSRMMIDTTAYLVKETNAKIGYCQSDEISLCWQSTDPNTQIFFDGRVAKIISQLAAMTSVYFYRQCVQNLPPEYAEKMPTFDCRAWNVPTRYEASNTFLWREIDAAKNSVSMAARAHYEHKDLQDKNGSQMQEMLFRKGVNWNDYPRFFKRGTFVQRRVKLVKYTANELEKLPPLHNARRNPELEFERSEYVEIDMPPFSRVTNRDEVIFEAEEPIAAAGCWKI